MDTQTDPPTSVAVIRRAINERPFAIMGTVYSSLHRGQHGDRAPGRHSADQRLRVGAGRHQKGNPNIFLTSFSQQVGFAKLVSWLVEDLKAEKIALIYVNNAFGRGGREMFLEFLKERGQVPRWPTSPPRCSRRTSRRS